MEMREIWRDFDVSEHFTSLGPDTSTPHFGCIVDSTIHPLQSLLYSYIQSLNIRSRPVLPTSQNLVHHSIHPH
eukprot:1602932-Prymnesium_polylepis.1